MWVHSIVVLNFFQAGFSMCGIAVSSRPAGDSFSSFWLTVSVKDLSLYLRQIAALFICPLLSKTGRYFLEFTFNGQ